MIVLRVESLRRASQSRCPSPRPRQPARSRGPTPGPQPPLGGDRRVGQASAAIRVVVEPARNRPTRSLVRWQPGWAYASTDPARLSTAPCLAPLPDRLVDVGPGPLPRPPGPPRGRAGVPGLVRLPDPTARLGERLYRGAWHGAGSPVAQGESSGEDRDPRDDARQAARVAGRPSVSTVSGRYCGPGLPGLVPGHAGGGLQVVVAGGLGRGRASAAPVAGGGRRVDGCGRRIMENPAGSARPSRRHREPPRSTRAQHRAHRPAVYDRHAAPAPPPPPLLPLHPRAAQPLLHQHLARRLRHPRADRDARALSSA